MAYSKDSATQMVLKLVTAGLESGAIKMHGTANTNLLESAEKSATADAAYLAKLISNLSTFIQTQGD